MEDPRTSIFCRVARTEAASLEIPGIKQLLLGTIHQLQPWGSANLMLFPLPEWRENNHSPNIYEWIGDIGVHLIFWQEFPKFMISFVCQYTMKKCKPRPRGGGVAWKMYTPARTAPRYPYPHWHNICETLPLLAQNLGPNPYPYWHKSTKRVPFVAQILLKSG